MDTSAQSNTTTQPAAYAPEFIPLPQRGPDPIFGLSRSTYYDLERRGLLRLVRIRKPGNKRGKVLIPVAEMRDLVRRLGGLERVSYLTQENR